MVVSRLSNHAIKNPFLLSLYYFSPSWKLQSTHRHKLLKTHLKFYFALFFNSKASSISSPPFEIVIFESNSACKFIFSWKFLQTLSGRLTVHTTVRRCNFLSLRFGGDYWLNLNNYINKTYFFVADNAKYQQIKGVVRPLVVTIAGKLLTSCYYYENFLHTTFFSIFCR